MIRLNISQSGHGPNLVLLHGWAMNSLVWGNWLVELEKSFTVICVELPGHGASDYNEAWTLDDVLESMALQLPNRCHLLGWSLGGMIALAYAKQNPQRVDGCVMMASSAKFVEAEDWPHAQQSATFDLFSKGIEKNASSTIRRFLLLQTQGMSEPKKMGTLLRKTLKNGGELSTVALVSGLEILQGTDLREAMKTIECPLMLILGKEDQLVPVGSGLDSLRLNPAIELRVIEGASHVPFLSHPVEVASLIRPFVLDQEGIA